MPKKPKEDNAKQRRAVQLIDEIKKKVSALKHGYVADEELDKLEELVKTMK